ncbi:hypothetical protein HN51_032696 [Arachis hypogaea]
MAEQHGIEVHKHKPLSSYLKNKLTLEECLLYKRYSDVHEAFDNKIGGSHVGSLSKGKETSFPKLKKPDNVDITIELREIL